MPHLTPEQYTLAENIDYEFVKNSYTGKKALGLAGLSSKRRDIIRSTVSRYLNDNLRGGRLRKTVAEDCEIKYGFIIWIQLAIAIYQIIKILLELRS